MTSPIPAAAAFGAGITLAALFIALPKVMVISRFVPLFGDRLIAWRSVVLACVALSITALARPLTAALLLLLLVSVIAIFTDLTTPEAVARDIEVHDFGTWDT